MTRDDITAAYRGYIACLNARDWQNLHHFVADHVVHNGLAIGLDGYQRMLIADVRAIPDLRFDIAALVCDPPMIAVRLSFDCTPVGDLFGIPVNGQRVRFDENVFYRFDTGRIAQVWSIIDKTAIAAQV